MFTSDSKYLPNGKIDPGKLGLLFLAIVAVLSLFGLLYSLVSWYIPIVIFQIYLAYLFGLLISKFLNQIHKICKVRNMKLAITTLVFGVFIALYFSWLTWVVLIENRGEIIKFAQFEISLSYPTVPLLYDFAIHPDQLLESIVKVYNNGLWTLVTKHGNGGGNPVSGYFLLISWGIEAVIITYFSVKNSLKQVKLPFSEETNNWISVKRSDRLGFIDHSIDIELIIKKNNSHLADLLKPLKGSQSSYSQFILFGDPATKKYLTVINYESRTNKTKNGKGVRLIFKKFLLIDQVEICDATFLILDSYLNKSIP